MAMMVSGPATVGIAAVFASSRASRVLAVGTGPRSLACMLIPSW